MWWQYIIIAAVLVLGIYAFLVFTGFETRTLSRRTARTAEDMYPGYADSLRKQRQYAKQHGEESANNDGGQPREPERTQPPEHGKPASGGPHQRFGRASVAGQASRRDHQAWMTRGHPAGG